jgi:hypothetical protein
MIISYDAVRDQIKDGDIIFFKGTYLGSRVIQKFTGCPWSHVAVVALLNERVLLLEAEPGVGVRIVPLSHYLYDYRWDKPYKGSLFLYRHMITRTPEEKVLAFSAILDCMAEPYNWWGCIYTGLHTLFDWHLTNGDKAYHCAELVNTYYKAMGLPLSEEEYITPKSISDNPSIIPIGELVA